MGMNVFLGSQRRPYRMEAVPQRSSILGVPFYLCVQPLSQNYQI